jgi:hypothetical protein
MANVGAPVGKARPVLAVVAEDGTSREGISLHPSVVTIPVILIALVIGFTLITQ